MRKTITIGTVLLSLLAAASPGWAEDTNSFSVPSWAWGFPAGVLKADTRSVPLTNALAYAQPGAYAGWPANFGMWSWGDEMVVGFFLGKYLYPSPEGHTLDPSVPLRLMTARSRDGGMTWDPAVEFQPLPAANLPLENVDFTSPNFAFKVESAYGAYGFSQFYVSIDRAHTWYGPYPLPTFGFKFICGRTDYIIKGPKEMIALLSGADNTGSRSGEGGIFAVHTQDGGKSWTFLSWVTPPTPTAPSFYIMPSSVQLPSGRIVTATRHYDATVPIEMNGFIDLFASDDQGQTWKYLSRAASELGGVGNPPAMVQLRDGRLALCYGRRIEPYGIRARLSSDGGQTWGNEIILRKDGYYFDVGYARAAVRPGGKVVTAYYMNTAPPGGTPSQSVIGATVWAPGTGASGTPANLNAWNTTSGINLAWSDTSGGTRGFRVERLADYGTPKVTLKAYKGLFQPPVIYPAGTANAFVQGASMGGQRWLEVPTGLNGLTRIETDPLDWYYDPLPDKYTISLSGPGTIYLPLEFQYYGATLPWMDNSWTDTGLMADSFGLGYGNFVLGWSIWKKEVPAGGEVTLGSSYSCLPNAWNLVNFVVSGTIGWTPVATLAPGVTSYIDSADIASGVHYSYRVVAVGDSAGDSDASDVVSLVANATTGTNTPLPTTTTNIISDVAVGSPSDSSATITWTTLLPSDSQVEYGATTGYGNATPVAPALVTHHSVLLTNLTAGTRYHYRVKSSADGFETLSSDYTFSTLAAATPPTNSSPGSVTNVAAGLWLDLTFDELSGNVFSDASGNGNSATLVTGYYATPSPSHTTGRFGAGALYLNGLGNYGLGDYLTLGSPSQVDVGSGGFALSAWIRTTAKNDQVLLNKYINAGLESGYLLAIDGASNGGCLRLRLADGNNNPGSLGPKMFKDTRPVNDGLWHHVAVVVNRTTRETSFYVDGRLSSVSYNDNSGNFSSTAPLKVGSANGFYGSYFTGTVDGLRAYNRALSDSEVAALAQTQ